MPAFSRDPCQAEKYVGKAAMQGEGATSYEIIREKQFEGQKTHQMRLNLRGHAPSLAWTLQNRWWVELPSPCPALRPHSQRSSC